MNQQIKIMLQAIEEQKLKKEKLTKRQKMANKRQAEKEPDNGEAKARKLQK